MSRKRDKPYFSRHAPYSGSKRRHPPPPHPEPEPELDKPTYKQPTVPPTQLKPPSLPLSAPHSISPSNPKKPGPNARVASRRFPKSSSLSTAIPESEDTRKEEEEEEESRGISKAFSLVNEKSSFDAISRGANDKPAFLQQGPKQVEVKA